MTVEKSPPHSLTLILANQSRAPSVVAPVGGPEGRAVAPRSEVAQ
jgi:hypothetical protein